MDIEYGLGSVEEGGLSAPLLPGSPPSEISNGHNASGSSSPVWSARSSPATSEAAWTSIQAVAPTAETTSSRPSWSARLLQPGGSLSTGLENIGELVGVRHYSVPGLGSPGRSPHADRPWARSRSLSSGEPSSLPNSFGGSRGVWPTLRLQPGGALAADLDAEPRLFLRTGQEQGSLPLSNLGRLQESPPGSPGAARISTRRVSFGLPPLKPSSSDEEEEAAAGDLAGDLPPSRSLPPLPQLSAAALGEAALPDLATAASPACQSGAPAAHRVGHEAASAVEEPAVQAEGSTELKATERYNKGLMVGVINAAVSIPVMLSFAAIIFQDPFFHPHMGQLVKLVFLSSAIHQAAFTLTSSLPFAVGQVQDVGLLFLSAMASSVVALGTDAGESSQVIMGTVLLTLTLATLIVGLLIIAVGYLRWAQLVQYVPLPVVGGYLGYVGYFCLASGVALASGKHIKSIPSWLQLLDWDPLVKAAPAVGCAALLSATMKRFRSPWALPGLLVIIPAAFYAILYGVLRSNLQAARDAGWVTKPQAGHTDPHFWAVYKLFNIDGFPPTGVYWGAMPRQVANVLALFFVVAFGSSMDVAAIQQDSPGKLDFNKELITVGISNVAAGLAGAGYTGSYIFSQTVFSMRVGVNTKLMGLVVIVSELLLFGLPFSVIEYCPNFFFGALMIFIGWEIAKDWLISSMRRMMRKEYALLWLTFLAIMVWGLEIGIGAGIVMASMLFSYSYAKVHVHAFTVVPSRSGAVRTFEQRTILDVFAGRVVSVSLSGYIFFGSAVKIGEKVLQVAEATLAQPAQGEVAVKAGPQFPGAALAPSANVSPGPFQGQLDALQLEGSIRNKAAAAMYLAPAFLLLDFRRVNGMDGSAARQFSTLRSSLEQLGIELIITHLPPSKPQIEQLLLAHGVIAAGGGEPRPGRCRCFPVMELGLQHCEEQLLAVALHYGLCKPAAPSAALSEVLRAHLQLPRAILPGNVDYEQAAREMERFFRRHHLRPGEVLFQVGDGADEMSIIEAGSILCQLDYQRLNPIPQDHLHPYHASREPQNLRLFKYGAGLLVGELDFFLQRPRSFQATCEDTATLLTITRPQFERMAEQAPHLLVLLETIILRATFLSASHALEALERSGLEM